jgi:hypothetical protein
MMREQLHAQMPLIRLPAPSPGERGGGNCRTLSASTDRSQGTSPRPACGERVRVRGNRGLGGQN